MIDIASLRTLHAATTPGVWSAFHCDDDAFMNSYGVCTGEPPTNHDYEWPENNSERVVALTLYQSKRVASHKDNKWEEDSAFIAAAHEQLPALLDELEALREKVERLENKEPWKL